MNCAPRFPECPRTDAILALHLDGDLDPSLESDSGYSFACGESLCEHLRDCVPCQIALRRARCLDAALARAAGSALAAHGDGAERETLEHRWMDAVAQAIAEPATPVAAEPFAPATLRQAAPRDGGTSRHLELLFAVATAVVAAVTWFALRPVPTWTPTPFAQPPVDVVELATPPLTQRPHQIPTPAPTADAPPVAEDAVTSPAMPLAMQPFPAAAIQRLRAPERRGAARPDTDLAPAELQRRYEDRACDPAERLRAFELLLDTGRGAAAEATAAREACINLLATSGDGGDRLLRAEAYVRLRTTASLLVELRSRLIRLDADNSEVGNPAAGTTGTPTAMRRAMTTVFVAANVGDRELDLWLRRIVRHRPEFATGVVAAARSGDRLRGAGQLLLDLWQVLDARGAADDEARLAATWFLGQPAAVFAELTQVLRSTRSAAVRRRCLLALGHAADDSTAPVLLRTMQAGQRDEAMLAAYALGDLPHAVLETLAGAATADDWLLHAALARSGLPAARPWLDALELRADERLRLERATPAEWPAIASWFRERGPQLGE